MECPSSPALANLVMFYILKRIWINYRSGTEVDKVLSFFKREQHKKQFTMEREVKGKIGFMDEMVLRSADGFLRTLILKDY